MLHPARYYQPILIASIIAMLGTPVAGQPSPPYTMPEPSQCGPIDTVIDTLRTARPRAGREQAAWDRYIESAERFRAACLGALDFGPVPGGSADALVRDAPRIGATLPQYRSASFACISDFEMCKQYYLGVGSRMDANLSCGVHYMICTGTQLLRK